jgi:nitrate reductase delta subunit
VNEASRPQPSRSGSRLQAVLAAALLSGRGAARCTRRARCGRGSAAPGPGPDPLKRFVAWWAGEPELALQQHYVELFDLHKRCGLYLTNYGDGDRRARGQTLLRLKRLYRAAGLPLENCELPDYLPVMLEFAASAPDRRGTIVLREHRVALELLRSSLRERATPYADLLDAVCLALGEPSVADRARTSSWAPPAHRPSSWGWSRWPRRR